MNKLTLSTLSIAAFTLVSVSPTFANVKPSLTITPTPIQSRPTITPTPACESSYGGYGQQTCDRVDFVIDKKVADPKTVGAKGQNPSNFQDNFGINADKYVPGQQVPFQITIKNTATKTLTDVVVKDRLPNHVTLVSPKDIYDDKTRELTINVGTLKPNETKTLNITVQITAADKLPKESVICLTNKAVMTAAGQTDEDDAQFCVQKENVGGETKGGLKVHPTPKTKTTPPTGPEMLALIPLVGSAIGGLILRKKTGRS